jgi:hypothetical protein
VRLQREMSSVEKADLGVRQISFVGFCTGRQEKRVVLAPNRQQLRLVVTEIGLEGRIEGNVACLVEHQVELDLVRLRAQHVPRVERDPIG